MTDKQKDNGASKKSFFNLAALHNRLNSATLFTPAGLFNALYGSQVRGAVRDFAVNIVDTVGSVVTLDSEKGDRAADWLKNAWNKVAAHADGKFDFRMASGWKMPEGIKYNGRLPNDPQYKGPKVGEEIQPFWSIFYRDKKGNVEVIDSRDVRFGHIVGPYIAAQAALMATVGTRGLTSLRGGLAVANGATAKVGTTLYLTAASADLWGGGAQILKAATHSILLKPEAINRFAHLIDNADRLTPAQLQKDLNLILEQYAKKEGRNTAQYFIPPLTSPAGAMELLDQLSKGQVRGYVRTHAFAEISANAKKQDISIGNIRDISENPHFRRSFLKLAIKAIDGQVLNQSEEMALRFGMNILFAQKDMPLSINQKQSGTGLSSQTLKVLKGYISEPIISEKFRKYFEEDKSLSPDQVNSRVDFAMLKWVENGRQNLATNTDMVALLNKKLTEVNEVIRVKDDYERQKLQAQAQARMLMMN